MVAKSMTSMIIQRKTLLNRSSSLFYLCKIKERAKIRSKSINEGGEAEV